LGQTLFLQVVKRAADYSVYELAAIKRIAQQIIQVNVGAQERTVDTSDDYRKRQAYLDGQFTQENDLDYTL
jgi:hypothetical protein